MGPCILRVVAFFYLAITTSQATLIHPIGGAVAAAAAGKAIFDGAAIGAAGMGAIAAAINQIQDYWKSQLGANTQMPKAIKDCLNAGDVNQQGGFKVDANSLIKFKCSFVPTTTDKNLNINLTNTISFGSGGGGGGAGMATGGGNGGASMATGGGSESSSSGQASSQSQWSSSSSSSSSSGPSSSSTSGGSDQIGSSSKSFYGPPRSSAIDMAKSYGAPVGSPTSTEASSSPEDTITSIQDSIASLFFSEGDMSLGKKMNLHFPKSTNTVPFLPRDMVDKIPFTVSKIPDILNQFNLKGDSQEANILKETLSYCEDDKGGDNCCTSLESMIDFATSIVGKSAKAISTNIDRDTKMEYKVQGIKKLPSGNQAVTCSKIPFPCAVFYCQQVPKVSVFLATLVGTDGSTVNAPTLCHEDTSSWDPSLWVFQNLHAQPGSCPVCRFMLDDDVLWIPK